MSEQKSLKMLEDLRQALDNIKVASTIKGADMEKAKEQFFSNVRKDYNIANIIYEEGELILSFNNNIELTYPAMTNIHKTLQKMYESKAGVEVKNCYTKVRFPGKYLIFSRPYIKAHNDCLEIRKELILDPKQHGSVALVIDNFGYLPSASK